MSEREEFEGPNYREKLDISQVFLRQRDRTNFAASIGGEHFAAYVRQCMRMLPIQWKQWVRDQSDRYEVTEPVLVFRTFSGVRLGTQKKPCLRDRSMEVLLLEDGSIDWSDPNILSPILKMKTRIDYEVWDEVVGEASELAGISWREEKPGGDRGEAVWVARERTPYDPAQEDSE